MRLELKLALNGAISKIAIFIILLIVLSRFFNTIAIKHTDKDLVAMKIKTLSIIGKIGIGSFLNEEKDSTFASYNILKDEFISLEITPNAIAGISHFNTVPRVIEDEEYDYRTLNYTFEVDKQCYTLEIGKNVTIVSGFHRTIQIVSISTILLVLLLTIFFDIGIYKYLLHPLNQKLIPKLKTTTNPETYDFSELKTSTTDFIYLNQTINELMLKVTTIMSTQKKFIADVSHELITPISVLQTKIENLASSKNQTIETQSTLVDLQKQLNRLHQIIKALLLISKIENDQYQKNESFYIHELVDDIIEDIEERASVRGISIENQIDPNAAFVDVSRSLLYILIFNLVNNAIKYGNNGGFVHIAFSCSGSGCKITVSDNGIGIEKEQIPLIFDRFKRSKQNLADGFGLGLSIVKSIAQFHGASIEVESVKNAGSQFKILFPLKYIKIEKAG